jgi:hypothetical protein
MVAKSSDEGEYMLEFLVRLIQLIYGGPEEER